MKTLVCIVGVPFIALLAACADDRPIAAVSPEGGLDATTAFDASEGDAEGDASSSSDAQPVLPAPPTLGTLVDRAGRPAANLALDHTFDPACTAASCPPQDAYAANGNPPTWVTSYAPPFAQSLAVYDGLDSQCGNQIAYGALGNPGYATLASVFADDRLYVDTTSSTCEQYLAVELQALGGASGDCGGRTLTENAIDLTYNALAGTLTLAKLPGNPGPITNGVAGPSSAPGTAFPYLAAPH